MNLKRLAFYGGIILVSGGCTANRVAVFNQRPSPVVEHLARHTPPAVQIRMPDHAPGSYIRICECGFRGTGQAPLYVIDGRRMTHAEIAAAGITPERIADISILKGPAAVEQYGPAAADGVVLITLKH